MYNSARAALTVIFLFISFSALAEKIEVPEEELATESVLPVFDKTVVVRQRTITTEHRFEVGGGGGLNLAEPLYNQTVFNLDATYHLDEINGVNLTAMFLQQGLSQAGKDLQAGKGLQTGSFDASLAPTVTSMFFGNYQFTAYYGKISITKQAIMHLSLYGLLGGGIINWTDTTSFGADFGVGQKLFFTPNLALRLDLLFTMYQGADPTSPTTGGKALPAGAAARGSDGFDKTFYFRPFLTLALAYLF